MKRIIPITLAAILTALGCSKEDSDQAYFEVSPASPLVHQSFRIVNARNVYEINLDVNSGGPVVGIGNDGTAWGYFSTPGMKVMRGGDSRNEEVESIDKIVGVRHTDELSQIADALPGGSEIISNADWQAYLFPELKLETRTAITAFENSPNLWGTIVARAVNHDGLWYLVDITNPALTGFSDTDGSTVADYGGRPTLINPDVPVDMQQDVADLGYNFQTKQQIWNTLLMKKPSNLLADPIADPMLPLPNGIVECDLVFSYTINNNPVTVGILAGGPKREEDSVTIAAFNDMYRNQNIYHNQSIMVVPMPTTFWKTFKAWAQEDAYHRANN